MKPKYNVFVSMPFGAKPEDPNNEWTKPYQWGILPLKDEFNQDYQLSIYRADHTLKDLALKDHVIQCIEDSDVVVCVLADNENVFWEVGFAEALEKPIAFMIDEKRLKEKKLPVLAGQPNFCVYNHKLVQEAPSKEEECKEILKHIRKHLIPYIKHAIFPYWTHKDRENKIQGYCLQRKRNL